MISMLIVLDVFLYTMLSKVMILGIRLLEHLKGFRTVS